MRKHTIRHDHLRKILEEFHKHGSEVSDELLDLFIAELFHSCLIVAGQDYEGIVGIRLFEGVDKTFALLFTDMDEFRKMFPSGECESVHHELRYYRNAIMKLDFDGYVLNLATERFILTRNFFEDMTEFPQHDFPKKDSYDGEKLKDLKNGLCNSRLESFIQDPANCGDYDGLFREISQSILLTAMVCEDDLFELAEDGIIDIAKTGPVAYLYTDTIGGEYATLYTSEERIRNLKTPLNKYSQIVNISLFVNFILNDDMDGIIINPEDEHILITRDVLLRYSHQIDMDCNCAKLNSAIHYIFLMEV